MLSDELLAKLHRLSRAEKLRVVQMLVNALAEEETPLTENVEYPFYSLYASDEAVKVLLDALNEAKHIDSNNISSHIKQLQRSDSSFEANMVIKSYTSCRLENPSTNGEGFFYSRLHKHFLTSGRH